MSKNFTPCMKSGYPVDNSAGVVICLERGADLNGCCWLLQARRAGRGHSDGVREPHVSPLDHEAGLAGRAPGHPRHPALRQEPDPGTHARDRQLLRPDRLRPGDHLLLRNQVENRSLRSGGGSTLGPGWGQNPPFRNRGWAPKFSRTLDTLWSVDSQKIVNLVPPDVRF